MSQSDEQTIARVGWGVTGKTFIPDDITALLCISPTHAYSQGEVFLSRRNQRRQHPWSLWSLEFEGTDVEETARRLLVVLKEKEAVVKAILTRPDLVVSISIWWETPGGYGGFSVAAPIFTELSTLSTRIDVYLPGPRLSDL